MLPVLYSFRRCPYAIRARYAILYAQCSVELREIELRNKPQAMLAISPKGTVPVLQLADGAVLEQSLDIMLWALQQYDPEQWLASGSLADALSLIGQNDGAFKHALDRYKYADRYPEQSASVYRQQGEVFFTELEQRLQKNAYLCGKLFCLADAAILPFIRQFAAVDQAWFNAAPYPAIQQWLNDFLQSDLFKAVMTQYSPWQAEQIPVLFNPKL